MLLNLRCLYRCPLRYLPICQTVGNVSETAVPVLVVDDKARAGELRAYFAPGLCPFDIDALGEQPLVEALSRVRPRLILLNPTVGGLDVPEVCRFLRDVARIPFVLVSPVADPEGVIVGLELGADDYVIKPYDPRELAARVRAVLRRYATNCAVPESLDGENSASSVPVPFGEVETRSRRDRLKDRAARVARNAWTGGRRPLRRSD
jgi:DNA-binding response OmpR family regulator